MTQKLAFTSNATPTVGIELELGLVNSETMALTSGIEPLLKQLSADENSPFKQEVMQCYIEVNTDVCNTIDQARDDLTGKLLTLERAASEIGMDIWWGATHPFSHWRDQEVTDTPRYHNLIDLLQEMARRMITFGLHVHVGVDSGDKAIMICDRIMQHLPTLLAVSCSSPFWEGRNTGLQSMRSKTMEGLPTAGLPPMMRNWSEYVWLVNHMIGTGFINTIREIWWDVRPHHGFGTVEVRVCDMPGNLNDALAIGALIQCLVKGLSDLIDEGAYQHDCHPIMVQQNKWRAARSGNSAMLIDSFTYKGQSTTHTVNRLVDRLLPTAEELDCVSWLEHVRQMAAGPNWSTRQLEILKKTGDPAEIVRQMVDQSKLDNQQIAR
jgi:carboxylate-amine ligase